MNSTYNKAALIKRNMATVHFFFSKCNLWDEVGLFFLLKFYDSFCFQFKKTWENEKKCLIYRISTIPFLSISLLLFCDKTYCKENEILFETEYNFVFTTWKESNLLAICDIKYRIRKEGKCISIRQGISLVWYYY